MIKTSTPTQEEEQRKKHNNRKKIDIRNMDPVWNVSLFSLSNSTCGYGFTIFRGIA